MDASERLGALVELLQRDGRVEVANVAELFGTAEMTIRRDLDRMVAMGMARRVRGGAVSQLMRGEELPFAMRSMERTDAKARIGTAVAGVLRDGEAVLLDSGSTSIKVAEVLGHRRLTVMPMSLHLAAVLSAYDSVRMLMPGGEIRPGELAMVGPLAQASIGALRFDTVVLGCCGVSDGRVTAYDLGDAAVKQAMLQSSARVILAADSSKLRQTAMAVVCEVEAVDMVVTDDGAPAEDVDGLRAAGIEVLCV
ncbi:MAG TPA: DeoR/GlpR family DNA-binding transcription regulator [Acidimicrobiales bacterium]|jgi:DeoR/GlpR family transcriptional regulator of sugar metabolism|nr:DeoR/GlpR family DNA-binding transcription regulator [Acidimicrobiales bacterium]